MRRRLRPMIPHATIDGHSKTYKDTDERDAEDYGKSFHPDLRTMASAAYAMPAALRSRSSFSKARVLSSHDKPFSKMASCIFLASSVRQKLSRSCSESFIARFSTFS